MLTLSQKMRKATSAVAIAIFMFAIVFFASLHHGNGWYEALEQMGYMLVIVATMGRVWCALYIGGRKDKQLCQDGPYSICRNPLYLFSFIGTFGVACAAQWLSLMPVTLVLFWGYYYFVMRSEEKRLENKFVDEFRNYCLRINRLFPSFRHYWSRETIEINPRLVIKAMVDSSWFLWAIVFLETIEHLKEQGWIDPLDLHF